MKEVLRWLKGNVLMFVKRGLSHSGRNTVRPWQNGQNKKAAVLWMLQLLLLQLTHPILQLMKPKSHSKESNHQTLSCSCPCADGDKLFPQSSKRHYSSKGNCVPHSTVTQSTRKSRSQHLWWVKTPTARAIRSGWGENFFAMNWNFFAKKRGGWESFRKKRARVRFFSQKRGGGENHFAKKRGAWEFFRKKTRGVRNISQKCEN